MIESTLKIARYCPLVIQGFSNFLGLFQGIMANPVKCSKKNRQSALQDLDGDLKCEKKRFTFRLRGNTYELDSGVPSNTTNVSVEAFSTGIPASWWRKIQCLHPRGAFWADGGSSEATATMDLCATDFPSPLKRFTVFFHFFQTNTQNWSKEKKRGQGVAHAMTKKMWEKVEDFFTVTCHGWVVSWSDGAEGLGKDAGEEWR